MKFNDKIDGFFKSKGSVTPIVTLRNRQKRGLNTTSALMAFLTAKLQLFSEPTKKKAKTLNP